MEVGGDRWQAALKLRMQSSRIFAWLDDLDNAGEDKSGRSPKRFGLQLPDAIHEDIARAQACANEATGALVLLNGDRLSDVADKDAVEIGVLRPQEFLEVVEHADAEVVEDTTISEGLTPEIASGCSNFRLGQLERRKETRKCRGCRDSHRHSSQAGAGVIHPNAITVRPSPHDQQPVAVERAEATLAQVGREDMESRLFGQLEEARFAKEEFLVVVLEESWPCELAVREAGQSAHPSHGETQRETAKDAIAHIERDERQQLARCRIELARRSVVPVPVEHEMRGEDAPARDRGDLGHVGQNLRVAEEADEPEVVQGGPEPASR